MFTDPYAVEKFKELVREFGVKTVVETGTYRADSTVKIAEIVDNTVSIEIVQEHFDGSKDRFKEYGYQIIEEDQNRVCLVKDSSKVTLYHGNSPDIIREIITDLDEPILFYLDAHWLEYWPLKDEIRAIKPRPNSLIVIHDCRVPGKDFGYDTWNGVPNEYDTIKDDLAYVNPNYNIFYNEKAAGSYRGILYAVPPKMGANITKGMLKINLGSFVDTIGYGWENWDILPLQQHITPGHKFRQWDARRGIPLDNDSVDLYRVSHLIEHLTLEEAKGLLSEIYRTLKPGGVARISTPDARIIIKHYMARDMSYFNQIQPPEYILAPTEGEKLSRLLFSGDYQHRAVYDFGMMQNFLGQAGFKPDKIHRVSPDFSHSEVMRNETRDQHIEISLVVEGIK